MCMHVCNAGAYKAHECRALTTLKHTCSIPLTLLLTYTHTHTHAVWWGTRTKGRSTRQPKCCKLAHTCAMLGHTRL
jgi:hypothetical protein